MQLGTSSCSYMVVEKEFLAATWLLVCHRRVSLINKGGQSGISKELK